MFIDDKKFDLASTSATNHPPVKPMLLNVGCGDHFHSDWVNLDLISESMDVFAHDLTCGLPFPDQHFDAVYHSHVLEHLNPNHGIGLLEECFRVVKPGGIMRIVVPDLERIAALYLEMHDRAWEGDAAAKTDYDWMKLELLDQLVRERSGGQMGQFMANPKISNSEFVQSRVGDELNKCQGDDNDQSKSKKSLMSNFLTTTKNVREILAKKTVRLLLGANAESALSEGLFRTSGEVHRWMYDRFSLKETCDAIGFDEFTQMEAFKSNIGNFENYELDIVGEKIRKPDSLFVECRRPVRMTSASLPENHLPQSHFLSSE